MYQDAVCIPDVVRVAAYVRPLVDDEHVEPMVGQPLGDHRTRKSRPNDQNVCFHRNARLSS